MHTVIIMIQIQYRPILLSTDRTFLYTTVLRSINTCVHSCDALSTRIYNELRFQETSSAVSCIFK